jgi:hypothetical protein
MIISDFITLSKSNAPINFDPAIVSSGSKYRDIHESINAKVIEDKNFSFEERDLALKLDKSIFDKYKSVRETLVMNHGSLPQDFSCNDVLQTLADSPKVNLAEARAIADRLNFVIIPFQYLDTRSWKSEQYNTVQAINSFTGEYLSKHMKSYVICPVEYYSMEQHIQSGIDLPIYAPFSLSQVFMAVGMNVPMFRSMKKDMLEMRNEIKNINDRLRVIDEQVTNLTAQVKQLAQQVQLQTQQALMRESNLREQLASMQASQFSSLDPMLLGIPNGKGILDNSWAFVGPCWGPDFEDIVMAAMNIKPVVGQRARLESHWGLSSKKKLTS